MPSSQRFALHGVRGPPWLQRISGVQLLAIELPAHCTHRRLRPELSAAPWSPAALGGAL